MFLLNFFSNLYCSFFLKILVKFLRNLVIDNGFILVSHNNQTFDISEVTKDSLKLKIKNKYLYRKIIFLPGMSFGEGYMNGEIQIENGNVSNFLEIILKNVGNKDSIFKESLILRALQVVKNIIKKNNIFNSKKNVSHHYDISDELYKTFLDTRMQYSCGYFINKDDSLEKAQENKIKFIIKKLKITKDCRVLDIGSGWGGLSIEIAKQTGAMVLGVTLSENQLKHSKLIAKESGVDNLVDFKLMDYRNIHESFDRIVSVGMFEHVGKEYYQIFFNKVSNMLKDNGIALLHTIGSLGTPKPVEPWITKYIFPGGYIPTISEISPVIEKSKMLISDLEIWRTHYAKTLDIWKKNFMGNRSEVLDMFNEEFIRMWEYYLASCQYSFIYNRNVVFHILLSKKLDTIPVTRDYMYN